MMCMGLHRASVSPTQGHHITQVLGVKAVKLTNARGYAD